MSKLVYIAGPITNPDPLANANEAVKVADLIYSESEQFLVPVIPHMNLLWHVICPHPVEYWYDYDLELLARCDALFRIVGDSKGADHEVAVATDLGLALFSDLADLFFWGRWLQRLR